MSKSTLTLHTLYCAFSQAAADSIKGYKKSADCVFFGLMKWVWLCNVLHQTNHSHTSMRSRHCTEIWQCHLNGKDEKSLRDMVTKDWSAEGLTCGELLTGWSRQM